jgi:hypothetical protein
VAGVGVGAGVVEQLLDGLGVASVTVIQMVIWFWSGR